MACGEVCPQPLGSLRLVNPLILRHLAGCENEQVALVAPGIQHAHAGPGGPHRGQVDGVVLMPVPGVAHAAAQAEEGGGDAPQLAEQILLPLPAEAPIPQAEGGVDDAVVEPAGEEGAVDAGNGGRAPVSGIRQCLRLLPGLRCGGLLRRQQAEELLRQIGTLLLDLRGLQFLGGADADAAGKGKRGQNEEKKARHGQ